jgi:hypothetical protein
MPLTPAQEKEWAALELLDANPELAQRPHFDALLRDIASDTVQAGAPQPEPPSMGFRPTPEDEREWELAELHDAAPDWESVTNSRPFVDFALNTDAETRRQFFSDRSKDVIELLRRYRDERSAR